jgi:hypothetical protein
VVILQALFFRMSGQSALYLPIVCSRAMVVTYIPGEAIILLITTVTRGLILVTEMFIVVRKERKKC